MVKFPKGHTSLALLTLFACALAGPVTAEIGPPAGQMCPPGNYVIGFDPDGNIVCSHTCGNGVLDKGEDCDDGNIVAGDGCSEACFEEGSMANDEKPAAAAVAPVTDAAQKKPVGSGAAPVVSGAEPVITDVKPWSVVYHKPQLDVTIIGSGFSPASVVIFEGQTYTPSVNPAGTELRVTLSTADLAIGRYAIRVSNGPGKESLKKKAITVY